MTTTFSTLVGKGSTTSTAQPKMLMYTESKSVAIVVKRAPRITDHDDIGQEWGETRRTGREPILRRVGTKAERMSMQFFLGNVDITKSIQAELDQYIRLSKTKERVFIIYGTPESGIWQITSFNYTVDHRAPGTHAPTRARVDITFRRLPSTAVQVGAVSGGTSSTKTPTTSTKTPSKAIPTPQPTPAPAPVTQSTRTYTIKAGDTLWALSIRYYGTGTEWRRIADANGITNPRTLRIGSVLRIP